MTTAPQHYPCRPDARLFPPQWRSVYFRRKSRISESGLRFYDCPNCQKSFTAHDLEELQGDHIWPYALFGTTTWDNYQLLCGQCNRKKGAFLQDEIRTILSSAEFHQRIAQFLKPRVGADVLRLYNLSSNP